MAELSAVELGEGPISIEVDGEFDLADEERAQELIDRALESSAPLLIDLTTCSFMDSTGLRTVIAADARAKDRGGRLIVVRAPEEVDRVFRLTRMDQHLEVVDQPPGG